MTNTENVAEFTGATKRPLPVDRVLTNPSAVALTEVIVLGWGAAGEFYFAASDADLARAMMLLSCAQRWVTDQYDLTGKAAEDPPANASRDVVVQMRQQGFTGNTCSNCGGSRMLVAGHCEVCSDCGTTTGCS